MNDYSRKRMAELVTVVKWLRHREKLCVALVKKYEDLFAVSQHSYAKIQAALFHSRLSCFRYCIGTIKRDMIVLATNGKNGKKRGKKCKQQDLNGQLPQ